MHRCPSCGAPNPIGDGICSHHIATEVNWAVANRVFCDLLHRRIEPAPVAVDFSVFEEEFELAAVE